MSADALAEFVAVLDKLIDELAKGKQWKKCCGTKYLFIAPAATATAKPHPSLPRRY